MTSAIVKIRLFRARIPEFECVPGCHDCCGPVTTSSVEMARLPRKSAKAHAKALEAYSCPHLGPQGCSVYAERPLICRLYGTTPRMPCPRGRGPETMVDARTEQRIMNFFARTRQVLV